MAGEWLKFEKSTFDKPEVLAIAAAIGQDPDYVIGKLLRMWSWFDTHTEKGNARSVTCALLDSILRVTGFSENVAKVGWLIVSNDCLTLPNFDRHCGETAKSRALTAKRVAGFKARNGRANAKTVSSALPREEKRREEKKEQDQKRLDHRADDRARVRSDFDTRFWPAYPRKVGKANAEKAWRKIDPDPETVKDIIAAIAVQRESDQWCRDGGQFIPHPATWLNGRRWEDEGATTNGTPLASGMVL